MFSNRKVFPLACLRKLAIISAADVGFKVHVILQALNQTGFFYSKKNDWTLLFQEKN
jgi:hypothetical protein